jgi:hypothetical protein
MANLRFGNSCWKTSPGVVERGLLMGAQATALKVDQVVAGQNLIGENYVKTR